MLKYFKEKRIRKRKERERILKSKMFSLYHGMEKNIDIKFGIQKMNNDIILFRPPDEKVYTKLKVVDGLENPVATSLGNLYFNLQDYDFSVQFHSLGPVIPRNRRRMIVVPK